MLTLVEQLIFMVLAVVSLAATVVGFRRVVAIIRRGEGELEWGDFPARALDAIVKTLSQQTVLTARPRASWFHAFVAWGFLYFLIVNVGDLLEAFIGEYRFLGHGHIAGLYRLGADLFSVAVLVGMLYFVHRRFLSGIWRRPGLRALAGRDGQNTPELSIRPDIPLHPAARAGMRRDSAIVAGFILLHVGARWLGQSFRIAQEGPDPWQPFAGLVAGLWSPLGQTGLVVAEHATWWLAIGLILAFLPYFPYSKHLHLLMAPVNFVTKPKPRSLGALSPMELDFEATHFGSNRLEHLPQPRLVDAFACIMCNRCQDVCPAYAAGTTLSPAALEINKRYEIKEQMGSLAAGAPSRAALLESVITADAVWACTSCAACIEICPVGNEPMQDLMDMRRYLTLTEGALSPQAAATLRNIEMRGNPWGYSPGERADWAKDLGAPLLADHQDRSGKREAEVLFWVGCSGSYDPRSQEISRAVARLLQRAGVDFAILGPEERCTGDPARRMGEEAVFQAMVEYNAQVFGGYRFEKVITACAHCFNVLENEYADFGVHLNVQHHSQFIAELIAQRRLAPRGSLESVVTFHDSCYLGRYNGEYDAPRAVLSSIPGLELREMPRNRQRGFCCGGGGGGVFHEVPATQPIPDMRVEEAIHVNPQTVATACPFCVTMLEGSPRATERQIQIKDVAELLDEATCD